jgi:uncharacterized protein DUF1761
MHSLSHINWLAVLVAGIVIFALGGLWYSKLLFANRWIALQNRTEEQMRAQMASSNMPVMYASVFLTGLITAWGMALVLAHFSSDIAMTAAHGAMFGFLFWLAFAATTSYGTALFSGKPKQLWLIDSAYNLVSFVLAGIILAVWR